MRPTNHVALPVACLFTLATAATACAMGDRNGNTASDETRSQQEIGKQIVTDTKRHKTESGSETMRQQPQSETMTESQPTTEDQQRASQQLGESGNAMGVPEPGTLSDQESTEKTRNPGRQHQSKQNAQVTVGGAKPIVYGVVIRLEGDDLFVKDGESGEEVRLIVNRDTNFDCGAAPKAGGTMSTEREHPSAGATERQQAQGQRGDETAAGSGFKTGDCAFEAGDNVKAEVSDVGTVTTLKFMPDEPGSMTRSSTTEMRGTTPQGISEGESGDRSPSAEHIKKQAEGKEAPGRH